MGGGVVKRDHICNLLAKISEENYEDKKERKIKQTGKMLTFGESG